MVSSIDCLAIVALQAWGIWIISVLNHICSLLGFFIFIFIYLFIFRNNSKQYFYAKNLESNLFRPILFLKNVGCQLELGKVKILFP